MGHDYGGHADRLSGTTRSGKACESCGVGGVAAPAGERGKWAGDRLLQRCGERRQVEELLRERACQHGGLEWADATLRIDLSVVGEPEDLREELGQA
jgi:hypothetical protein